jgi:hypothetical protein
MAGEGSTKPHLIFADHCHTNKRKMESTKRALFRTLLRDGTRSGHAGDSVRCGRVNEEVNHGYGDSSGSSIIEEAGLSFERAKELAARLTEAGEPSGCSWCVGLDEGEEELED